MRKSSSKPRILIAEDNPANQALLRMQFGALGCETDIAGDGAAALGLWREHSYDLLLADRRMPGTDGLELASAIRFAEAGSDRHIPIVGITAGGDGDEFDKCRQAGMDDILLKPIEMAALQQLLRDWLPGTAASIIERPGTAASTDTNGILNSAGLTRLVGQMDQRCTQELISLFIATANDELGTCRRHLAQRDGPALALVMHKLKSSARTVGALSFVTLAETIEQASRAGRLEEAAGLYAELEHALDEVAVAAARLAVAPAPTIAGSADPARIPLDASDILVGIRRNEFEVHFQPKLDAVTLDVVGLEALARWRLKDQAIPPEQLIAAAEQHDLTQAVSEALLMKSLVGSARLTAAGFPLPVAVNLATNWLATIHLPAFIQACVVTTGLRTRNVILEITGRALAESSSPALGVIRRLQLMGFRLSVGDFGPDVCSLDPLQTISFDELKFGRESVRAAALNETSRARLTAAMTTARKLNASTVAVGVETREELNLVREMGCDLMQGFLLARPMPMEELTSWLKARQP